MMLELSSSGPHAVSLVPLLLTGCHWVFPFDVRTEPGDARVADTTVVDRGGGPEAALDATADTLPHVPVFAPPVLVPGPVNSNQYDDGPHTLSIRSFDGSKYSDLVTRQFIVDNEGADGGDGGGALLWALVIVVVVVVVGAAAAYALRARRR